MKPVAVAALVVALLLAGCGGSVQKTSFTATAGSPTPSTATAGGPTPTPGATPTDLTATTANFGQVWIYEDGLKIWVGAAKHTFGKKAVGHLPGRQGVVVTVAVTNDTNATYHLTVAAVKLIIDSAGTDAPRVTGPGVGVAFPPTLATHRKATARIMFDLPAADVTNELEIMVDPGLTPEGQAYARAEFVGKI